MGNPQRYSEEFRERTVRRIKQDENVSQLARELSVDRTCLVAWELKLGREPYGRVRGLKVDLRDRRIEELEAKVIRLDEIVGGQFEELYLFESAMGRADADGAMSGACGSVSPRGMNCSCRRAGRPPFRLKDPEHNWHIGLADVHVLCGSCVVVD
jgi:hypothetical protein